MSGTRYRRTAVAVGLAAGALLLAPPASADVTEGPSQGQVLTTHGATTISATHQGFSRLQLFNPAGQVVREATGATLVREGTLSVVLNTACPAEPADGCAPSAPGANGRWVIRQSDGAGNETDSREFVLSIGGTPPTGVTASLAERTVTVSWKPGPEPDLTGFEVSDDSDDSISKTVRPADACADGTCTTTFDYPSPATGERSFSVRALRAGGEGRADVAGAAATTEPVALPAPPADPTAPPSAGPTGSPSASPGTPGAPGAPAAGGDGQATAQSFAQGFSSFAPSLGLPKVPPLPATTAPQVAGPLVADTFEETLEYGEREAESDVPEPIAAPGRETVLQSTGGLLGDEQLLRSVAGALVMLLAGGHLRTWLARSRPDDLG